MHQEGNKVKSAATITKVQYEEKHSVARQKGKGREKRLLDSLLLGEQASAALPHFNEKYGFDKCRVN